MRIAFILWFFYMATVSDYRQLVVSKHTIPSVKESNAFKPDSSINKRLFLHNYESAFVFCQDKKKLQLIERVRESSVVIFSNQIKNEYLLAYFYEGNTENAFSCFEIGNFEDDSKVKRNSAIITKESMFKTESDLGLGSTLAEVIQAKGKKYSTKIMGKDTILTYQLSDKNAFVKRYFMPGYFMEFRVRDNKVRRITFGFDYP